jgi:hypothetical protein
MKYIAHQKSEIKNKNEIHCASEIKNHKSLAPNEIQHTKITLNAQQPTLGSSVNLLRQKSPTKNKNENSQVAGGEAGPK